MVTFKRFLTLSMMLIVASGCHDAAYEKALAEREKRIHDKWNDHMIRESGRPLNIEKLNQTAAELQAVYAERLNLTLRIIENKHRQDWQEWGDDEAARQAYIREMLEGKPDDIPKAWGDMTH